ncbi:MAG: hypothetical protein ACKVZJ_09235 [Phycisphaerales bacterium]
MKNLMPWLKSNVIWIAALAVAVIALPVSLFFSTSWNASIKKTVGDDVSAAVGKLQNLRVDYALPAVVPGQTAWSVPKTEPNTPTTQAVVAELKRIALESASVRELAFERNKAGKKLMVDGLFPAPMDESARVRLSTDLVAERPKAMERILREAGAGAPPDPARVLGQIQAARQSEMEKRTGARVDTKPTAQDEKEVADALTALRMEQYQRAAASVRFFGDVSAFAARSGSNDDRGGAGGPGSGGTGTSEQLPNLTQAWLWQMEQWVREDVVAALVKANTGAAGQRLSAIDGPVKRLLRVSVLDPVASSASSAGAGDADGDAADGAGAGAPAAAAPAAGDEKTEVPKDLNRAHTGKPLRSGLYDVVEAEVEIICDSSRLPTILRAFEATNLMSVIDADMESYDPRPDLALGFAYGNDHLVRATIRVETVWLRGWLKAWMPKEVRTKLGIPEDAPPPAAEGAADGAATPPQ